MGYGQSSAQSLISPPKKPTNNHIQAKMRLLIFCVFFSNYSLSATQGNVKLPEQGKTLRKREKREKEGGLGRAMARIREKTGGWRREGGFWRWKSREDRG